MNYRQVVVPMDVAWQDCGHEFGDARACRVVHEVAVG